MKKNVGSMDKVIRIALAVVFVILIVTGTITTPWNFILGGLAAILVLTSLVSFCPIYLALGLSSIRHKFVKGH